MLIKLRELEA